MKSSAPETLDQTDERSCDRERSARAQAVQLASVEKELKEVRAILETERRELRHSQQWFRDIANRIEDGLWVRNADGTKCLYLSPAFERIFGRTIDEMNQINWSDALHPDDRQPARQAFLNATETGSEYKLSYRIVRPDGAVRYVENRAFPVFDDDKALLRMAGIARDITEQHYLEEELRVAQKLESVGQLAAGIAHEINTPSQYVSDNITFLVESIEKLHPILNGYVELLKLAEESGADEQVTQALRTKLESADLDYLIEELPLAARQSKSGIEQITKIVLAMKDFSHPSDEREPVDLNKSIETTVIVARNEWKYVAEVELDLMKGLPSVPCVRSAINQVILNIVVNAAHAIEETIEAGRKGVISIKTSVAGSNAMIEISDTGAGMPESVRQRIFDPFFTTKAVGRGTGQGLSIAYSVVTEQHQGLISVESEPGEGARFKICLPLDEPIKDRKD